ncbi:MAG: hypothetical protein M3433_00900 [Actinomycetota bacterium]|nr:hypothetical protein [Actinomycetota bacterium]
MTQTAVVGGPRPEPVKHVITWRDAVTPVSRASRRRWTAVYPLLLAGGGIAMAAPQLLGLGEDSDLAWGLVIVIAVVFGMLRRGTRRLTAVDHPELDERDESARADAFRAAYPFLLTVLALSALALFVVLPDIDRSTREGATITSSESGFFLTAEAMIGFLLWGFLWAVFLPTGVLAWREPDALDGETVTRERGVSEPVRDALLASALVVGLGASLLSDTSVWLLLALLAVLTALGAIARRTAGEPAVSAATKGGLGVASLIVGPVVATLAVGGGLLNWLVVGLAVAAGLCLLALAVRGG